MSLSSLNRNSCIIGVYYKALLDKYGDYQWPISSASLPKLEGLIFREDESLFVSCLPISMRIFTMLIRSVFIEKRTVFMFGEYHYACVILGVELRNKFLLCTKGDRNSLSSAQVLWESNSNIKYFAQSHQS